MKPGRPKKSPAMKRFEAHPTRANRRAVIFERENARRARLAKIAGEVDGTLLDPGADE